MNKILFVMQGQPTAKAAGDFAIGLAKSLQYAIVAEYTIDRSRLTELDQFTGEPGMCGSGAFVEAEKQIVQALAELAESMFLFFGAVCEGNAVAFEQFIEVGQPTELLVARARDCSCIILPGVEANIELAKQLIDLVACPVVFVHSEITVLVPKRAAEVSYNAILAALEDSGYPIWLHEHLDEHQLFEPLPQSSCLDHVTYSVTAKTA